MSDEDPLVPFDLTPSSITQAWYQPASPWRHEGFSRYIPIGDYALIGDMHTAALVALNGSIDWCCMPQFDSPSVFGALLDANRGGRFRISPAEEHTVEQRYLPATNVVTTIFHGDAGGIIELWDFMPVTQTGGRQNYPEIHRRVRCTRGKMDMVVSFQPRLNYGATSTRLIPRRNGVLATDDENTVVTLAGPPELWWKIDDDAASIRLSMYDGDEVWFVLRYDDDEVYLVDEYKSAEKLDATISFWDAWVSGIRYKGKYRAAVERSALALKLMCFEPTGAMIAAPTTSLPTQVGGTRNWDYRYTWLRDSAFTLNALQVLGQQDEATQFLRFLRKIMRKSADTSTQIMYGIDGRRDLPEQTLDHLEGYNGSSPVRVGNNAYNQRQLGVHGAIIDAAYWWSRAHPLSEGTWASLERLVTWVAVHWREPDCGMWEVRRAAQHYVISKVMCWVALDRGIRMAEEFDLPGPLNVWLAERDAIKREVLEKGWSDTLQSFTQAYGTTALDAANLIIPMVGFLPADDSRVVATVQAIARDLTSDLPELVFRYRNDDGWPGQEAAFSTCTFWLAQALAMCGEREQAEHLFRRMLKHANHVGLYSEQLDPDSNELLGNFPQAFTHVALINCANTLAESDL